MIHKLSATELLPGMYVADLALSSQEFPHVFAKPGLLQSSEEIAAIQRNGFREAFIDDEKSTVPVQAQTAWADLFEADSPAAFSPGVEPKKVRENLEQAVAVYASSIESTRQVFGSLQKGKELPVDIVYQVAGSVVESLMGASQTLTAVTKLQSFDDYTFTHCVNVSVMATMFGKHLEMESSTLYQLAMAGLLHDIGKLAIPYKLLNTARRLSDNEFSVMKKHAELGYEILKRTTGIPKKVKLGVFEHHERYDGSGYPNKKKNNEISLFGRILALVDVYDALTSKRVYKAAVTPYATVSFLYSQRGEAFDPPLVDRFIQSVGIYPAGSVVQLSSGETGVVYLNNPHKPLLPVVAIVMDANGAKRPLKMVNLGAEENVTVKSCPDPGKTGINGAVVLKACAMAEQARNEQATAEPGLSILGVNLP